MDIGRLAPAGPPVERRRSWTVAASVLLHLAAFAILLSMTARRPSLENGGGPPSYDFVFAPDQAASVAPAAPDVPQPQGADVPAPEDTLAGAPAPTPSSEPSPDGVASDLPEAAQATLPPPATAEAAPAPAPPVPPPPASAVTAPQTATAPAPTASTSSAPVLAFAPPAPEPEEATPAAPPAPPSTVRLGSPPEQDNPRPPAMIMPRPPPPLPPAPPRARPAPRPLPGTMANPMDLSFGPSLPRPAAGARRGFASRALDLSIGPPRQGPARSDPYAQIRAANASADWNRGLLNYWLRHRYYPQQAVENHEDGTVEIQLTVNRSGRVETVELKSRSGSQWLDMAAVGTFRNGQLPPFTPEMTEDRITFTIPIQYILVR